jgi:hypothetical protein
VGTPFSIRLLPHKTGSKQSPAILRQLSPFFEKQVAFCGLLKQKPHLLPGCPHHPNRIASLEPRKSGFEEQRRRFGLHI